MSRIKVYQKIVSHKPGRRGGIFVATLECGHIEKYINYVKTHPKKIVCRKCSIAEFVRQRAADKEVDDATV